VTRFVLTADAARDIEEIWDHIAADNVPAARRLRLRFKAAFLQLARNPRVGHPRSDLTDKPVLFWPVGSYLVVYTPNVRPLQIVRLLHGARDIAAVLR
jgi:antitoxin ParD1/3/4/toxin ParE1/3/4